jgi:ADP-ribose pyrophosphatase
MYKQVGTEYVFHGKVFEVRVDQVEVPTGDQRRVDIVEHGGSVAIVPIDGHGRIWLVRQYRHPAGAELLELPAGTLEDGEDPMACARRESQEEIGMAPGHLEYLGACYLAPGYSTERMEFYLATDLGASALPGDEHERLQVVRLPVANAFERLMRGEFSDVKTIAGITLALARIGRLSLEPS